MGEQLIIINSLHQSTSRNYLSRMNDHKIECMEIARKYDQNYWDGERRYGYGGYRYLPGRWTSVAQQLITRYNLSSASKILDVGCGKAHLLYEIKSLLPNCVIIGFDASEYAIKNAKEEIKSDLFVHKAEQLYRF